MNSAREEYEHAYTLFRPLFDMKQAEAQTLVNAMFGMPAPLLVRFRISHIGRSAGRSLYACGCSYLILNPQLVDHPEFIEPTIAHEFAHHVTNLFIQYGGEDIERDSDIWSSHGHYWTVVAEELGCDLTQHDLPFVDIPLGASSYIPQTGGDT